MRKTPLKTHPLQKSIESFQRSPLYECKQQLRGDEKGLKKIGRNRLVLKDAPLPQLNPRPNKENVVPNLPLHSSSSTHLTPTSSNTRNLSFGYGRVLDMEQKLSRMVASQKQVAREDSSSQKLKEALLRKQFFIRDRKILPQRNCMSSSSAKRSPVDPPPEGVRQFRKLRTRKSRQLRLEEEGRQIGACQQAQRLAEECRPGTAPNASRHPVRSASLQDFLNEWKHGAIKESEV